MHKVRAVNLCSEEHDVKQIEVTVAASALAWRIPGVLLDLTSLRHKNSCARDQHYERGENSSHVMGAHSKHCQSPSKIL